MSTYGSFVAEKEFKITKPQENLPKYDVEIKDPSK